jgi:ATP/maltotriose-dependent transcriptional regulator MalT/DNA-binding SARP family transcriptional activator
MLHRSHLLAALQNALCQPAEARNAGYKLVMVCAPAGYGKTTLLVDVARSMPIPCCWYFLEKADADIVLFLRNLLLSIREALPTLTFHALELLDKAMPQTIAPQQFYQPVIDLLCQELETQLSTRVALVLCNMEQINDNEELSHLLHYLLSRLPSQATLVIESRVQPRLQLTSLFIHNELYMLPSDALRFTAQEILALAQLSDPTYLTADEAEQLCTFFDGWIAGILLAAELAPSTSREEAPKRVRQLGAYTADSLPTQRLASLLAYLERDVFQGQEALYHFLYKMSILQYMDAEICNTLLHTTDADALLVHLEQQGLFVRSHDTGYVCQTPLRHLLSTQLRTQDMALFTDLHRRAASIWLERRNYAQAMYHACEMQAHDLVIHILDNSYHQLLAQGNIDTLQSWLQAIDPATREHTPLLCLIEAHLAFRQGQHATTLNLLERAAHISGSLPTSDYQPALSSELLLLRIHALYRLADYQAAQTLCQQTLSQLPDLTGDQEKELALLLALCALRLGNVTSGIPRLQAMLYQYGSWLSFAQLAEIHTVLGDAYEQNGNIALAEHHLTHALRYYEQLQDEQGRVQVLLAQGQLWRTQGNYAEATACLQEALQITRSVNTAHSREADVLACLGLLALEQQHYMQALTFFADGLERSYQEAQTTLTHILLTRLAITYLLLGDAASAHLLLDQAQAPDATPVLTSSQIEHALAYSLLLLYQQRYSEAYVHLQGLEQRMHGSTPEWRLQPVYLHLAACHLACQRQTEALRVLEQIAGWLREHPVYRWPLQVELQWLPHLQQMIYQQTQRSSLYTLLREQTPLLANQQALPLPTNGQGQTRTTPALSIRAFSEPEVLLHGQPVRHWRMARTMELFFLLLDADDPLSKEQIITELWPHFDEQVNQTFHSTIHYLRKILGASSLLFQDGRYHLQLAATYGTSIWYDVQQFQSCAFQAEQALAQQDRATAKTAWLQMVELYRGDYGRPFYNNWCLARRRKFRNAYLEACRQLAQFAWHDQAYEESIEYWQRMLHIDDCLEEAHLGLMQCYARLGQRSQALRQYRACQDTLQQELGIEPEAALQQFYQSLILA